jgi:hypothetical protein
LEIKTSKNFKIKKDKSSVNLIYVTMFALYLKEGFYGFIKEKKSKI